MNPQDSKHLPSEPGNAGATTISFREALGVWMRIGVFSFGGPAGQIALMHRMLVEEKRWVDEERFLHALNYCMLLPGPEAQQLATYIGWLMHRIRGGLAAGILFVLPGAVLILILSMLYAGYQQLALTQAVFFGIKAAVLAIVVEAVLRIGRRALKNRVMLAIAAASFVGIFFFDISFPLIVLGAGIAGFLGARYRPLAFETKRPKQPDATLLHASDGELSPAALPSTRRALKVAAVCLLLWLAPVVGVAAWLGADSVYVQQGAFFSKMAVVTFGGAYAVLAYVAQQAVDNYGWLEPGEMLDGLGLAETTPGPLIMVVQFVGFLGAYRNPGALDPLVAGTLGALMTTWVTFVPCFLWIFLGAPYVENLRGNRRLSAALSSITAAVVGVILNLAIWFALHVMFGTVNVVHGFGMTLHVPDLVTVEPAALVLVSVAMLAMLRYKAGMLPVLAVSALLGTAYQLIRSA